MKTTVFIGLTSAVLCAVTPGFAQRPATQTEVFRPTTKVSVNRPATAVSSSRPTTSVSVSRPTTASGAVRPQTSVNVSRPATEVSVSKPDTTVTVSRPTTVSSATQPQTVSSGDAPSATKKTSMSDYATKEAKSFAPSAPSTPAKAQPSASPLVQSQAAAGLGNKIDESAKDASAAANQAPKGQAVDIDAKSLMEGKGVTGSNLADIMKQKLSNRSAGKK